MNKKEAMKTIYELCRDKRLADKRRQKRLENVVGFLVAVIFFLIIGLLGGIML